METNQLLTPSAADGYLAVGTLLRGGRYRIERYLASGGFGKTYVASDLTFENTVVVKEFYLKGLCVRTAGNTVAVSQNDNQPFFETQQRKFRKEAKRIHNLVHPNIVKVHDLFDENGTSYYTMNFVNGDNLRERVKRRTPLSEDQVWSILAQLLDALAYIHERHIWHLDLKPANVLIDAAGHVTLIDFGASKLIDNNSDNSKTTSSAFTYTPGFAPLEQEGHVFKDIGPWTDFYALGATLYNIVSGNSVPRSSEILAEGTNAFSFPTQTSQKLRGLIVWMMKLNHKERPQSADAIRGYIETAMLPAPQESVAEEVAADDVEEVAVVVAEEVAADDAEKVAVVDAEEVAADDAEKVAAVVAEIVAAVVAKKSAAVALEEAAIVDAEKAAIVDAEDPPVVVRVTPQQPFKAGTNGSAFKKNKKMWIWGAAATLSVIAVAIVIIVWPRPGRIPTQELVVETLPDTVQDLSGTFDGHDYVDLGLPSGTLWATCNVGASCPDAYGDYFAWGETKPKSVKSTNDRRNAKPNSNNGTDGWRTYFDTSDAGRTFQKYNNKGGKTELDASDDAATANWGEGWRMPSREQQDELREKCTWTWRQKNGAVGYEVKSKINDNSIFLPAAGSRYAGSLDNAGSYGSYWSRSLSTSCSDNAYRLYFNSGNVDRGDRMRCFGRPVRPVRQN